MKGEGNMSISVKKFGQISNEEIKLYTLTNGNGMSATFTNYGAVLTSLMVPDKHGKLEDVVLGFDNLEGYQKNTPGFGSFIGRHGNRIGDGRFKLNGKVYELDKNDGKNNLHGGFKGYNKMVYETEYFEEEDSDTIEFSRLSPDMEQGFPGNLDICVTYTLTDDNELVMEYLAVPDQDTLINLTNHSYFNLGGHKSGTILNHKMWIDSDYFTPTTDDLIPTGEIRDVTGTPMDFRTLKTIGQDIDNDYLPLKQGKGYDHNYVLKTSKGEVSLVASLLEESFGRKMEVFTDLPGVQVYTANNLEESENCKGGTVYHPYGGVCFETQFFPNSCNIKEFKPCVFKAGEEYDYTTVYRFTTI